MDECFFRPGEQQLPQDVQPLSQTGGERELPNGGPFVRFPGGEDILPSACAQIQPGDPDRNGFLPDDKVTELNQLFPDHSEPAEAGLGAAIIQLSPALQCAGFTAADFRRISLEEEFVAAAEIFPGTYFPGQSQFGPKAVVTGSELNGLTDEKLAYIAKGIFSGKIDGEDLETALRTARNRSRYFAQRVLEKARTSGIPTPVIEGLHAAGNVAILPANEGKDVKIAFRERYTDDFRAVSLTELAIRCREVLYDLFAVKSVTDQLLNLEFLIKENRRAHEISFDDYFGYTKRWYDALINEGRRAVPLVVQLIRSVRGGEGVTNGQLVDLVYYFGEPLTLEDDAQRKPLFYLEHRANCTSETPEDRARAKSYSTLENAVYRLLKQSDDQAVEGITAKTAAEASDQEYEKAETEEQQLEAFLKSPQDFAQIIIDRGIEESNNQRKILGEFWNHAINIVKGNWVTNLFSFEEKYLLKALGVDSEGKSRFQTLIEKTARSIAVNISITWESIHEQLIENYKSALAEAGKTEIGQKPDMGRIAAIIDSKKSRLISEETVMGREDLTDILCLRVMKAAVDGLRKSEEVAAEQAEDGNSTEGWQIFAIQRYLLEKIVKHAFPVSLYRIKEIQIQSIVDRLIRTQIIRDHLLSQIGVSIEEFDFISDWMNQGEDEYGNINWASLPFQAVMRARALMVGNWYRTIPDSLRETCALIAPFSADREENAGLWQDFWVKYDEFRKEQEEKGRT